MNFPATHRRKGSRPYILGYPYSLPATSWRIITVFAVQTVHVPGVTVRGRHQSSRTPCACISGGSARANCIRASSRLWLHDGTGATAYASTTDSTRSRRRRLRRARRPPHPLMGQRLGTSQAQYALRTHVPAVPIRHAHGSPVLIVRDPPDTPRQCCGRPAAYPLSRRPGNKYDIPV